MAQHPYGEIAYLDLIKTLLDQPLRADRTGTGTYSMFAPPPIVYDTDPTAFPLFTAKRIHVRSVIVELLWFMRGRTDVKWLKDRGCTIWDEWELDDGTIGPGYGRTWRDWDGHDQLKKLVDGLAADPQGRRHIINSWNVPEIEQMALPPCHLMTQWYVRKDIDGVSHLDCQLYQRSADIFLGVPFNVASYAVLVNILAWSLRLKPGRLTHVLGDAHLYANHVDQARELLSRDVRTAPRLQIDMDAALNRQESMIVSASRLHSGIPPLEPQDFAFVGYDPHPTIKAPVAV